MARRQDVPSPLRRAHAGKLALGVGAAVLLGWLLFLDEDPRYPTTSSHWHADYVIEICGREVPRAPYSQGDVHTHGDGRIHVHPSTNASAGRAANLEAFFRSIGRTVTTSLTVGGGDGSQGRPGPRMGGGRRPLAPPGPA